LPYDPKEDSLLTETSEFLFYAIEKKKGRKRKCRTNIVTEIFTGQY